MSDAREFNKAKAQPWSQTDFSGGMVKNAPHEEIPQGSVALLRNAHAFPKEIQPRLASKIYSEIQPPILLDSSGTPRSGYGASQSGTVVTSLSGDIFAEDDVSNFFVWPGSPNYHSEIIEYLSATQVRVDTSEERVATYGCWLHARLNLNVFHAVQRKKVYQWGVDVYVADDITITSWTKAVCVSHEQPSNVVSGWSEMDDYGVIANSNGIFLLDFSQEIPVLFKKNTPIPSVLIEQEPRGEDGRYRYDYLYSMSRLNGAGIRDRTTEGAVITQESGTVALNPNTSPNRDYGTIWTDKVIDSDVYTQGRLWGNELTRACTRPSYWFAITGVNAGAFRLEVNGERQDFFIDFGPTGYFVGSLADVAAAIQTTVRTAFPFATCEYLKDTNRFVFSSGLEAGSTMGYGLDSGSPGFTDIAGDLQIRVEDDAVLDNEYPYAQPKDVGVFTIPRVPAEPEIPEQHWTHYSVYRTEDIGPEGVSPRVVSSTREELQPLKFTWVKDVRTSGAFLASRTDEGLITASVGTFEPGDVGTPLKWEDGEVDTITEYISSTQVNSMVAPESDYYYGGAKTDEAAAIGGGRVFRGSQAGNTVTRLAGPAFTISDERKTIHWAIGYYSYITEFIDADTVLVHDAMNKDEQGFTTDPVNRVFTDDVPDVTLRNRQGELYIGLLAHRFYVSMPNANIISIVPGFMITARLGESSLYYCQLPNVKKYLSGYHLENRQINDRVEGAITAIRKIPNKFIVYCSTSTWGGPTNVPDIKKLPEFGEAYNVLHVDIIDEDIGVVDVGSIREVYYGVYEMRTSDNAWRQFSEYGYDKRLADMTVVQSTGQDIIKKDFNATWPRGASAYLDTIGHIWWGKGK